MTGVRWQVNGGGAGCRAVWVWSAAASHSRTAGRVVVIATVLSPVLCQSTDEQLQLVVVEDGDVVPGHELPEALEEGTDLHQGLGKAVIMRAKV